MEYDIKDPENYDGVVVLATPYYEGECFIPIDVTDYFVEDDYYEIWDGDQSSVISPPKKFSSFFHFLNWFKNDGMEQMFEIVIPHLEMKRDEYKTVT